MNSREKGKRGEREAAAALSGLLGVDVRRSQQYAGGIDSADVVGVDGLHVEVKHQERMQLYKWMAQAVGDASDDSVPLVMHRQNRREWLCTVRFIDLLRLVDTLSMYAAQSSGDSLQRLACVEDSCCHKQVPTLDSTDCRNT
jgi:hypothetical protein